MSKEKGACLVCGRPLIYHGTAQKMTCVFCRKEYDSYAGCEEGHYVCDNCHAAKGAETIKEYCFRSDSCDPITIAQRMMEEPHIYLHGPEHHSLVGAALLTAYHNAGGAVDLAASLDEMIVRGGSYPGGSCGYWGCCGAAVSTGMFLSIVTGATPLTGKSWRLANRMTVKSLAAIGELDGPRCCKRNSFTAIRIAVEFVREELGIVMQLPKKIVCTYSDENRECLRKRCPYHLADQS